MIELYRALIPANKVINDNHDQHYRIHYGNIKWLSNQFESIMNGNDVGPGNFKIPSLESINNFLPKKNISIICEVWKCNNRLFDPQNYAKTFKAPLDLLVKYGYLSDDNWKLIKSVTYLGGGKDAWNWDRPFRYQDDGLPNEINQSWWEQWMGLDVDYNGILIRILLD